MPYYKVKINDEESIVKAKNAASLKEHVLDELNEYYNIRRASTDEVIDFLDNGTIVNVDKPEDVPMSKRL